MAATIPLSSTAARIARTEAYAEQVRRRFAACVSEILSLHKTLPVLSEGEMYSFDAQSMKIRKEVEVLLRRLHASATLAIQKGIKAEWDEANKACDSLLSSIFGKKVLSDPVFSAWTQRNNSAMQAFIERSDNGLNLSNRVWQNVRRLRDEMEVAITISIGDGESAASMSRRVRTYLNDPDLMFRRFRYKDAETGEWKRKWKKRVRDEGTGKTHWIDCDSDTYKTGTGIYKSSAKNAMRLARTETNIAYRRADHERWQQMDFVLGQRINLSNNHPAPDICDTLKGDYPKDFLFDGWHPQCFCYVTPILASEEEMIKEAEALQNGEYYEPKGKKITSYPQNFENWVTEHSEQIAASRDRGTEPYFIRNNAQAIDDIINPQPKELSILEKAKLRHDDRTPEQEEAIKNAWEERKHKHQLIKKTADNVLNVAQDYGEIDYSELQAAIKSGDLTKMQELTKTVAKSVSAMKKQEAALADLMPNAHELHQSHSMSELKEAYNELDGVMKKWLSKYSYSSVDTAPLEHLRNKLDFELTNPTISYSQKEIVKKAITEKIRFINQKLAWNDLISKAASLRTFKTKSSIYKDYLAKIDDAIKSNNFAALQKSIADAEAQQQKLIEKQIKRGGDTKSALNKEYKGGAIGKDISSSIDTSKMVSEDPYGGTFTNNVARMQGFDAPAKLVSESEFAMLEKACGDVFYRTVNPTTFKGKKMSSKEFASQLYVAELLELNGPGGRAYGDGMYVATSAWNGRKLRTLTDSCKNEAYNDSICYGNGSHTISEMTWTRIPKIIKQSDLYDMWRKLTPAQRRAFGNNENTYACALGYDAMYCDGPNYMVIWNRSIIAVKKK